MRFALVTNTSVLETNKLKMHIQTSPTNTQLATSDFQTELVLRWLLLSGTQFQKWAVAITLSYLRVGYTHKIYMQ